jgi:hypothetical protein
LPHLLKGHVCYVRLYGQNCEQTILEVALFYSVSFTAKMEQYPVFCKSICPNKPPYLLLETISCWGNVIGGRWGSRVSRVLVKIGRKKNATTHKNWYLKRETLACHTSKVGRGAL